MSRFPTLFKREPRHAACAEREEDLLFYLHNELPPLRRLALQWHLSGCAGCRAQLEQLTGVSQQFANVLRGESLPRWSPPLTAGAAHGFVSFAPASDSSRLPMLIAAFAVLVIIWSGLSIGRAAAFYGYYEGFASYSASPLSALSGEAYIPSACEVGEVGEIGEVGTGKDNALLEAQANNGTLPPAPVASAKSATLPAVPPNAAPVPQTSPTTP